MAASASSAKSATGKPSGGKPAGKSADAPAKSGKKAAIILMLLAMPVAVLLLPTTLVLIPAMMPTIVARIVDLNPGRHLTVTVGSLNFAGSLWFMHDLWAMGHTFAAVVPVLSNMMAWLIALLGAGAGWAIFWVMPLITRSIAAAKASVRLNRIRKAQAELVELWGQPVQEKLTPQ
jgi:hypothetical protein